MFDDELEALDSDKSETRSKSFAEIWLDEDWPDFCSKFGCSKQKCLQAFSL